MLRDETGLPNAERVIEWLGLAPHPEGGYFAETFRAPRGVTSASHPGPRAASTAIYFLLKTGEFSAFHRVRSDEVWHHYLGDPLELRRIDAERRQDSLRLGPDLERGERPQAVVLAGHFQAARPVPGPHGFSLCGCTVAPGFDFSDFELPARAELLRLFPEHAELVTAFTR
jgi:predicted cupin superfamily sugar epimerase